MKRVLSLLLLLAALPLRAATGDTLAALIDRTGTRLYLNLSGLATNLSYSLGTSPTNWTLALPYQRACWTNAGSGPQWGLLWFTNYATCVWQFPYHSSYIFGGAVSGGPFLNGETVLQTGTTGNRIVITDCPCSPLIVRTNISDSPNASGVWTGQTSGATITPLAVPTLLPATGGQWAQPFQGVDAVPNLWLAFALKTTIWSNDVVYLNSPGGFYSGANAISALSVANGSWTTNALPMLRWNSVPGKLIPASGVRYEAESAQCGAMGGVPVCGVKFILQDTVGGAVTNWVTALTQSQEAAGTWGRMKYNYGTTFNMTSFASLSNLSKITVDVISYPCQGTGVWSSVGNSYPEVATIRALLDTNLSRVVYAVFCNTNGGPGSDSTGVASSTYATALASPCLTMGGAAAKAAAWHADGRLDGSILYAMGTNSSGYGSHGTLIASNAAVRIQPDPTYGGSLVGPDPTSQYLWSEVWIENMTTSGANWCFGPNKLVQTDLVLINNTNSGTISVTSAGTGTWNVGGEQDHLPSQLSQVTSMLNMGQLITGSQGFSVGRCLTGCYLQNGQVYGPSTAGTYNNIILSYDYGQCNPTFFDLNNTPGGTLTKNIAIYCCNFENHTTSASTLSSISGPVEHLCYWQNSTIGQRLDWQAYWSGTMADNIDYPWLNWSIVGNSFEGIEPNSDWYQGSAYGTYGIPFLVGQFPGDYGVGWVGNNNQNGHYKFRYAGYPGNASTTGGGGGAASGPAIAAARYYDDEGYDNHWFPVTSISGTFLPWEAVTYTAGGPGGFLLTNASPFKVMCGMDVVPVAGNTITGSSSGASGTVGTVTSSAPGGGNYHILSSSPLRNMIPAGQAVWPVDLDGIGIRDDGTGSAGAYQYNGNARAIW